MARFLEQHHAGRRVWLIYGAMRDKAIDEVAGLLFPLAHRVLVTQVAQSRAVSAGVLAAIVAHHRSDIGVAGSLAEALARARSEAAPADIIVITGSLFLVAEAKTPAT